MSVSYVTFQLYNIRSQTTVTTINTVTGPLNPEYSAFATTILLSLPLDLQPYSSDFSFVTKEVALTFHGNLAPTATVKSAGPSISTVSASGTSPATSETDVILDSTSSEAATTSVSLSDTSTTASDPTASATATSVGSGSRSNLVPAVGVLAGLLALALIAISFLLFRRRRDARGVHAAPETYSDATDPESSSAAFTHKGTADEAFASTAGSIFKATLDDRAVNAKFAQLDQSIADWVAMTFRSGAPMAAELVDKDVAHALAGISSEWKSLLMGESRQRFLLLRGLVANILCDAWASGELYGAVNLARTNDPTPRSQEQRARAIGDLNKTTEHRSAAESAIHHYTSFIDRAAASVVAAPQSTTDALGTRMNRLKALVTTAANLAMELGQQRVAFTWDMPPKARGGDWIMDPSKMEDALQDYSAERLVDRRVICIVFPIVERLGDDEGSSWTKKVVIRRAKVLV